MIAIPERINARIVIGDCSATWSVQDINALLSLYTDDSIYEDVTHGGGKPRLCANVVVSALRSAWRVDPLNQRLLSADDGRAFGTLD